MGMRLFPNNSDPDIVNQSEIDYRIAKFPFYVRHTYIDATTGESRYWDSSHCPVCFWKKEIGIWDSLIDKAKDLDITYCRRCGQAVKWE